MAYKIEKTLKQRDHACAEIAALYQRAAHHGYTSGQIGKERLDIRDRLLKGAPRWATAYVDGFARALTEQLYATSLVYGGHWNGSFYSTHRDRPDYYEKRGISPQEFASGGMIKDAGHYWAHDTSKPFFVSEAG